MRPPDYYRQRSNEARSMARALGCLAGAALLAGISIAANGGPKLGFLACVVVIVVSLVGRWIERAEAKHNADMADIEEKYQIKETKRHH